MSDTKVREAVTEKAKADKAASASPPATLPTQTLQNLYDEHRNS